MSVQRALPLSSTEGAQIRKMTVFHQKVHFSRRMSAVKIHCVKTVKESYKAFVGLFIHAKMVGGCDPFYVKILADTDLPLQKRHISYQHSLIVPQP